MVATNVLAHLLYQAAHLLASFIRYLFDVCSVALSV
jgi:hypothetical protein